MSSVVAVGTFDGVHRGHQHLLAALRGRAASRRARSVVVTFDPPPRLVLRPDLEYKLLTSTDERVELLEREVDLVELITFDRSLAATSAEQFCAGLVERHAMVELVGGPDLALGRGRAGTPPVLREIGARLGFEVELIDQLSVAGEPVRSGEVRRLLLAGDVVGAAGLLGRPPTLQGTVVLGDQRGRTLGFPTANIEPPTERLIPANGVYAARADGRPAVMNIGVRPTVDGTRRVIEAHLLDWSGDLYGQRLTVALIARLREERRFPSLEALVAQIREDVAAARAVLREPR